MANPDFELVIGVDQSASFDEMKRGLAQVINQLNSEPQRVKLEFDLKAGLDGFKSFQTDVISGMQGIGSAVRFNMEQINEIAKTAERIAAKDFSSVLDFSGAFTQNSKDRAAEYKAAISDYVKYVQSAFNTLTAAEGRPFQRDTKTFLRLDDLTQITEMSARLDKLSNMAGIQKVGTDIQAFAQKYIAAFQAMSQAGVGGIDLEKLLTIPEKPTTAAAQMQGVFTTIAETMQQLKQSMASEASETGKTAEQYDIHTAAVKAAAEAEKLKADVSGDVKTSLSEEAAAAEKAATAAEKDAASHKSSSDTYKKAINAVNEYYTLLQKLNSNKLARDDLFIGENGWESRSGGYADLAAQLNAAKTAFDMLTSAEAKNGMTAEQQAALQEHMAAKAKVYALAVEDVANKAKAASEKQAEAAEKAAEKQVEAAEKAAKAEEKNSFKSAARKEKDLNRLQVLLNKVTKAQNDWSKAARDPATSGAYADIGKLSTELQELAERYKTTNMTAEQFDAEFASLNRRFAESSGVIKNYGNAIKTWFGNGLTQLQGRLAYTFGLVNIVMKTIAEVKKMVSTAVELDSAMNQLQIVTRASSSDMAQYSKQVSQMAKETAQSTKDLIDATTVYARLGYTMDESSQLAKYTAMLQGVGDVEASTAQNAVTAIIKAYGKDVSEIQSIMDKMVEVGNNFPISVSDIAVGMNNAGSALSAAGNSLEQSIALLTAANTTIQNISMSSTGLRTIAARIRKTTVELDDLGETIEEAKYQEVIDLLTGKGVKLTENGQYRATYDILKDIAGIWSELSSMEQAGIAEQLAGTRQQNIFYSIIGQFNEAKEAMVAMQSSTGSLQDAYDIYLGSIQAHVNQLKAAFAELAQSVVDSSLAKGVIDFLRSVLELLNGIVSKLGGVGTILAGAGIAGVLNVIKTITMVGGVSSFGELIGAIGFSFPKITEAVAGIVAAAPVLVAAVGAIAGIVAVADRVKTIDSAGYLGEGHTISEYEKNVREQLANIEELEKQYKVLADSGADLMGIDDELAIARVAYTHATEEYTKALEAQAEAEKKAAAAEKADKVQRITSSFEWDDPGEAGEFASRLRRLGTPEEIDRYTKAISLGAKRLEDVDKVLKNADLVSSYQEAEHSLAGLSKRWNELNDGNVDYSLRPFIKGSEMLAAGYTEFADNLEDFATTYTQGVTIGDGDAKFTLDITPILNDGTVLSPEALDDYISGLVTDGGTDELLASDELGLIVNVQPGDYDAEYWEHYQEQIDQIKNEHLELAIESGYVELERAARESGLRVDELIMQYSGFNEATAQNIRSLTSLKDELVSTTAALENYNTAISGEHGEIASQYESAYKKFLEDWNAGKTGTKAVQAAVELILSDDAQRAFGYDLQEMGNYLSSDLFKAIFSGADGDAGLRFANYIRENLDAFGDYVKITPDDLTGGFDFAYTSIEDLAYVTGMTEEAVTSLLDALDAYGVQVMMGERDTAELAEQLGLLKTNAASTELEIRNIANQLAASGNKAPEILQILKSLESAKYIDLSGVGGQLTQIISDAGEFYKEPEEDKDITITTNADVVQSDLEQLEDFAFTDKRLTIYEKYIKGIEDTESTGTTNAPGGPTLVNEKGPEIISENGRAYIAGGGKPTVVDLDRGAVVLNAEDTQKALRGGATGKTTIRAADSGQGKYTIYTDAAVEAAIRAAKSLPTAASIPSSSGEGAGGSGSGGGGSSSSGWFEEQYKEHQHLLKMDQESVSDYLAWLDDAYKRAYDEGEIDLDGYRKYEEEVYKQRQDNFKDYLSDTEHLIELEKNGDNNPTVIINFYKEAMDTVEKELEKCYADGLDSTNDYVQYLQNIWIKYNDAITDANEDATKEAKDQVKDLVEYRIKMIKQELKDEQDALKTRIDNLKDFYDKQKDMLQKAYDDEETEDERAEKRKTIADLEAELKQLEYDNSAWAEKRKNELRQQLAESQKDLDKFEKQQALEMAKEMLDQSSEAQVNELQKKIDELEAKLNNPKWLYETALADVQNNSIELYEQMIAYNDAYGLTNWLTCRVIYTINNHTYMRGLPKAVHQNMPMRNAGMERCESRKNARMIYGENLSIRMKREIRRESLMRTAPNDQIVVIVRRKYMAAEKCGTHIM